ncbi:MAG: hypothetical protein ACLUD0_00310 [Eubacterium ramulus]
MWGILIGGACFVVLLIGSLLMRNQGISGDGLHVGMTLIVMHGSRNDRRNDQLNMFSSPFKM